MTKKNLIGMLVVLLVTTCCACKAQRAEGHTQEADNEALYDTAILGDNGLIYVTLNNPDNVTTEWQAPTEFAVIDMDGRVLIDGVNRWMVTIYSADQDYCVFGEKDKGFGIMDAELNVVIPAKYFEARAFGSSVAVKSSENSEWQIISLPEQKTVGTIAGAYDIKDVSEGMVLASSADEPFFFLDFSGKVVIPYSSLKKYVNVLGFREGLAIVVDGGVG
ncbi:MAG: hypothetical protein K2K97_10875, partial [Muribaculaceae bacterium]|nr:hypothetical protein [Muribaculaceae bacterium]